jgi:peptide/nickel transport system substrate-binding protein
MKNGLSLNANVFLIILGSLLLALVVACGGSATATSPPPAAAPTTAAAVPTTAAAVPTTAAAVPTAAPTSAPAMMDGDAKYGGTVPMQGVDNPSGWDPQRYGRAEDIGVTGLAYNQLVEYDPVNPSVVIGDLAEGWDQSEDGVTYTFNLNQGVQWTDGQPFTADDVVFSLDRLMAPDPPKAKAGLFSDLVESVTKIDPNTVEVKLKFAAGSFIPFLAVDFNKMLPKHVLEAGVDINAYIPNPVGTGPFIVSDFTQGVSSEYVKNADYFKEGRPYFDGIKVFIIQDKGTEIAAFRTEQVLMATSAIVNMDIEDIERLEADEEFMSRYDIYSLNDAATMHFQLNYNSPPMDDPKVRRALSLSMDRHEYTEFFGRGRWELGTPMSVRANDYALPVSEIMEFPGFRQLDGEKHPDDIAEAVRLLNEAGYTDDNPLEFTLLTANTLQFPETAQVAKASWERDLPVEITLELVDTATAVDRMLSHQFEVATFGAGQTIFDPDDHFRMVYLGDGGRNFSNWSHPEIEELFFKQQSEPDNAMRREIVNEMQRKVLNSPDISPAVIEYSWNAFVGPVSKKIRTSGGAFVRANGLYHALKHDHEWFDPDFLN